MRYTKVKPITGRITITTAVAAGMLLAGCGGGGGTSSSAGGGAAGTATVAGVVDNGGIASLDIWPATRGTAGERLLASLAKWISTPAHAAPVADVQVVLSCESGFVGDDTTDSEGVFEISGVPADDTCSLQVNGLTATVVETSPNSVININVTISPSGIAGDDTVVVGGTIEDNTGEDIVEEPSKKVTLCHKGKNTISVGAPAKPAHLAHGDTEGPCTEDVPPAEGEQQVTEQGSETGDGSGTGT